MLAQSKERAQAQAHLVAKSDYRHHPFRLKNVQLNYCCLAVDKDDGSNNVHGQCLFAHKSKYTKAITIKKMYSKRCEGKEESDTKDWTVEQIVQNHRA